jgi:glycosyltransferase involved in cell wall biosynthesis
MKTSAPVPVLFLVDGLGLSGKTKAMVDLIEGLDPRRHEAHVVCFNTEDSPLETRLRALGVDVQEIPCADGLNLQVMARIGAVVHHLRPEIMHCYNPRTMLYGGLVARALGVRGTVGTLSAFACLTPDVDHRFLPQPLFSTSLRNRMRNRLACRLMRAVVTASSHLRGGFCRYNGVDPRRMRVVGYGVDIERFARVTAREIAAFRARHRLPDEAVTVGSVGRLVEQKDYPTQLRAFAHAAARVPSLLMLLVGDGPLRGSLEAMARELGIADRVRFAGHTDDVPVALRTLEMFVLASKFEPYGVALLEAKAAGAAIVATRVNEVPEILGQGATGWLVEPEDPTAMGEAFARLAEDAVERQALGARAALDAAANHSLRGAIAAYERLYDQVRGEATREVQAPLASAPRNDNQLIIDPAGAETGEDHVSNLRNR